jgi:hypothetical protein
VSGINDKSPQARKRAAAGEIVKYIKHEKQQIKAIQKEHLRRLKTYNPQMSRICAATSAVMGERYVKP